MRILIDTNILVSGLFFGKFSKEVLSKIIEGNFEVCINEKIFSEYKETIDEKISKKKYVLNR